MEDKRKVALLSNVTVDLIAAKLRGRYDIYLPEGYDTWVQETITPTSGVYNHNLDCIVLLLDGTEARSWASLVEAAERISLWKKATITLTSGISSVPIFLSTIDIRENRIRAYSERAYKYDMQTDWYQFIQELAEKKNNVYVLDIADAIYEIGRDRFYSNKMWYMSSMPYSKDGISAICAEVNKALNAAFESRKKIIALDLDNTLWGGVIGEDGIEGIDLADHKEGQRYYDFQRQLLEMKKRGVLLAINSKNNIEDAEQVIEQHPAMLLRDDDFVSKKINWENKAANIKALERELNITEPGFVFVDDNPLERETVKGECTEAIVPDYPADTTELLKFGEGIWTEFFRPLRILSEDLNKTQMYQGEAKRKQDLSESINLDDYISRLDITVDIHRMKHNELDRVTQLINKTNQFNLTTKRYTQAEIKELSSNKENAIYVAYSSDKYGDSGLISVIILKLKKEEVIIDSFLMSCRVMGRKLENAIINELAMAYSDMSRMTGEYVRTQKNAPVEQLYDRLGFSLLYDDKVRKVYELNLSTYNKNNIEAYKEILFEK